MLRIILVRPGATDFDDQKRIQGTLGLPLNATGERQAAQLALELGSTPFDVVYTAPEKCAEQTAEVLAGERFKIKRLKEFQNLNYGLWHGKKIDEVKQQQPRVYRQWLEHPETVCPPGGEPLDDARKRMRTALAKLVRKHRDGAIAMVISEPMASLVRSELTASELGNLWDAECVCGSWETLEVVPEKVA